VAGGEAMNEGKSMLDWVREYVGHRRQMGYKLQEAEGLLIHFAEYVEGSGHQGPLTTEVALRWVQLVEDKNYQHSRFEMVRSFAKYLAIYEPQTEVPSRRILGLKCHRLQPHIYSQLEVLDLLRACEELNPPGGLRPKTYSTLFGLLAATGLRISEALRMNYKDVDLDLGVLNIRESKFFKSRLVPVHASTLDVLREYAKLRSGYHSPTKGYKFFISESGGALPYSTVRGVFHELRRRLGWKQEKGKKLPRIHDFRHSFVCRRILTWYEQGVNVDQTIPFLSVYLGHVKVTDTYWYLTGIPELMAVTAERFEQFVQSEREEDHECS
jgi:integrase